MYVAVVVPTYVDWIVKLFVSDLEVTSRPTKANVIKLFSRKGLCAKSLTNLLLLSGRSNDVTILLLSIPKERLTIKNKSLLSLEFYNVSINIRYRWRPIVHLGQILQN